MNKTPLPLVMVAPNGARRTKADHPAIPITDADLIETSIGCNEKGADGIHLHLRDENAGHLLDAERYRALSKMMSDAVPGMYLQVTSEAAGRYSALEQQEMMRALGPANVSVGMREMVHDPGDWTEAAEFYHWAEDAGVGIQHIVYSPSELAQFLSAASAGHIPGTHHLLLFVLGRYDGTEISDPDRITDFTDQLDQADQFTFDWMLCAFGKEETECLIRAAELGGKLRVGFEKSLWHADGGLAKDNAERVETVRSALRRAL